MGMRIDKAGRDDQIRRVDHLGGGTVNVTDANDTAAGRGDVTAPSRRSAAIHDSTVFLLANRTDRGPSC